MGPLGWEPRALEYLPTAATLLLAGFTFFLAYYFYIERRYPVLSTRFPRVQRLLENKFYFDQLYDSIFVRPLDRTAVESERLLEEPVIEGTLTEVGVAASSGAAGLSLVENGYFRVYMLIFVAGALVAAAVLLLYRAVA